MTKLLIGVALLRGRQVNSRWRHERQAPVRREAKRMDIEMRWLAIRRHHRRWGGDDLERAAGADPIDMPVAVHDDDTGGIGLEDALKPAAVDERRPDPLGEGADRHRILDQMMVQPDDPSRLRIVIERRGELARLPCWN